MSFHKLRATKIDVLEFVRSKHREVQVWEVEQHFKYRGSRGAQHALKRLTDQDLLYSWQRGWWGPTDKGLRRLRYYGRKV